MDTSKSRTSSAQTAHGLTEQTGIWLSAKETVTL